jgi:hypothetical protein
MNGAEAKVTTSTGMKVEWATALICPSGCFASMLSSPARKNILFFRIPKSPVYLPPSRPTKGRCATSRNAGRDAVDAGSAGDERRESGRRRRVVLTSRRWCQVGGGNSARRRWQKSPFTGESAQRPLTPSRAGMPGFSGGLVVTNSCGYFFTHARLRVHWAPGIPHALLGGGLRMTRAKSRRGNAEVCPYVIARSTCDEAIQLSVALRQSWIASLTLAMTVLELSYLRCLKIGSVMPREGVIKRRPCERRDP